MEAFHYTLFTDLYRREKTVNFEARPEDKKYYVVPLRMTQRQGSRVQYEIDRKLLAKVENLAKNGYLKSQPNILEWLSKKGHSLTETEAREKLLDKWMYVKGDKPNSCYTFVRLLANLKKMSAADLATELKCSTTELGCETGYELLYSAPTRFKSINGYREQIVQNETPERAKILMQSPICLLDPIKVINQHNFTYSLTQLKRNPKAKMNYKKAFR